MQEQDTRSRWVQVLARHGEKFALAAVLILAFGYLMLGVVRANGDAWAENHRRILEDARNETQKGHPDLQPGPAENYMIVPTGIGPQPAEFSAGHSAGTYFTRGIPVQTGKIEGLPFAFPDINSLAASVEPGRVTLNWKVEPKPKTRVVPVSRFVVERRIREGAWETLSESVPGDALSYLDSKALPRTGYEYRVRAVTDHDKIREKEGPFTPGVAVSTPAVFRIKVAGLLRMDDKTAVRFEVKTLDPVDGWISKVFNAGAGEEIGTGRFASDARVISAKEARVQVERTVCRIAWNGAPRCRQEKEKRTFTVTEIVYTDDRGGRITAHFPEVHFPDKLCPDHLAEGLLEKADAAWRKDPEAAKALYRDLKEKHRTTAPYRAHRERIDARAD